MAVDFLSIAPPADQSETVSFAGQDVQIHPLRLTQIGRIAQRFEAFRKAYFDRDSESNYRSAAMYEAWPAIICAGLGKDRSAEWPLIEAHVEKFSREEQLRLGRAVLALTHPEEAQPADDKAPLPDGAAAGAGADPSAEQ